MFTKGLLGIVVALVIACGWFRYSIVVLEKDLQDSVAKQEAAETSLRTAKQEQQLLDTQLEQLAVKVEVIAKERKEAKVQVDKMRDIFQDHDFGKLVQRKPGLVENLMIKKTAEVFSEIEELTAQ